MFYEASGGLLRVHCRLDAHPLLLLVPSLLSDFVAEHPTGWIFPPNSWPCQNLAALPPTCTTVSSALPAVQATLPRKDKPRGSDWLDTTT
ncbi:hypothetical protein BD311DRAFT_827759 [Dichomitus squalens]|uniref:Uncharacterized protein n=1 Tax=Dichomitus squalens TaxID=114155 RepID=A0A4Q9M4K5_9APHY|nr:hypothetical protein BD311DRAFT_827759 [Dichomitus squalens]